MSNSSETQPNESMQEYYQLQQTLLLTTLVLTGVIFIAVLLSYSPNIALNYLLGACVGLVYLRMLGKDVAALGGGKRRLSSTRLALVAGVLIVASQWQQLQIMPVFLGFLTYKAALIVYVLQTTLKPVQK